MTHEHWQELAALHALDALEPDDEARLRAHLESCPECRREFTSLRSVALGLSQAVPPHDPPPALRRRVLQTVVAGPRLASIPDKRLLQTPRSTRFATAAALLLAAASIVLSVGLSRQVTRTNGALARAQDDALRAQRDAREARSQLSRASASLAILTAPDVVRIDLAGQAPAPAAAARAYWSRSRGLVFNASHLPPAPRQKGYQLWVVTAQAPISAGMLHADSVGDVAMTVKTPPDMPSPLALAVTVEPSGGVASPTGDKYLVGVPRK